MKILERIEKYLNSVISVKVLKLLAEKWEIKEELHHNTSKSGFYTLTKMSNFYNKIEYNSILMQIDYENLYDIAVRKLCMKIAERYKKGE